MNAGLWSAGPRRLAVALAVIVAVVLVGVTATPQARAGDWMQVSCRNPSGSPAPSTGWSDFVIQALGTATSSTACSPTTSMTAVLADDLPEPVGAGLGLMYTPPADNALVGGTIGLVLTGPGAGTNATGVAAVQEPDQTPADTVLQCGAAVKPCSGKSTTFSGPFTLPNDLGGELYVTAGCGGQAGYSCVLGSAANAFAAADVTFANLLLQNGSTPGAKAIKGTLLARHVRGTARLRLTATDFRGPGVWKVAATIGSKIVHNAIPSRNHGRCRSVGTDPASGALMFDSQQPCARSVNTSFSVATAQLPDGPHRLQVSVTDAAQDTHHVLTRTITTFNPELSPRPHGALHPRFSVSWGWTQQGATLRQVTADGVPATATVTVSCAGVGCPTLKSAHATGADFATLARRLRGTRLPAGDRLSFVVAERHQTSIDAVYTARANQRPRVALTRAPKTTHGR